MKHQFLITLLIFTLIVNFAFSGKIVEVPASINLKNYFNNTDTMSTKISIKIGSSSFTATLSDNPTAAAFKALLPMTVNMTELNGNEKYFDLQNALPVNPSKPAIIQNGDLMLYGSNTLVLFYKKFSTSYSYTPIGRIGNPSGLAAALGSSNITITFELQ